MTPFYTLFRIYILLFSAIYYINTVSAQTQGAQYRGKAPVSQAPKPLSAQEMENLMKPNLYILSVGVSDYKENKYDLLFAHSDADSIAEMFTGMKGKLFNKVTVRKLLNKDATLVNIKIAINWLEKEATQKDMIVFFISSHGEVDNKGNFYLLPHDVIMGNLFATALNVKDVVSGISGTPCKKLILLDACHSGQFGSNLNDLVNIKDAELGSIVKNVSKSESNLCIMTSSVGKEESYEKRVWGHGAFTKAILEGCLKGNADYNKDKNIEINELGIYVSKRVQELTGDKQHPDTPVKSTGNISVFSTK